MMKFIFVLVSVLSLLVTPIFGLDPVFCRQNGIPDCPDDGDCTSTTSGGAVFYQCTWSKGISMGAVIGIILGIIGVVLLGVAGCYFGKVCCFTYRRNLNPGMIMNGQQPYYGQNGQAQPLNYAQPSDVGQYRPPVPTQA